MKQKVFFMIFQGLSVARNCLRPETVPLTILAIQRGLLYNFAKNFMGHSDTDFQLLLIVNLQNFHRQSFNMLKFFSNFALVSHFSITRFDILKLCNILHLEMNFRNLY